MRKGFSLIAGAVMAVSGGAALAAGHPLLGKWEVKTGGVIDLTAIDQCNNGSYNCSIVAGGDGNGFVQYTATSTAAGGETYIGTIIVDPTATGRGDTGGLAFSDESFVLMSSCQTPDCAAVNNGIVSQQTINETSADNVEFSSRVDIQTGEHFGATNAFIQISQTLTDLTGAGTVTDPTTGNGRGDDFMSDFLYEADLNTAGDRTGFIMEIDQVAGLTQPNGTSADVQSFTYREAQGGRQQTGGGNFTVPGAVDANGDPITVAYGNGADIKAVWLGQEIGNGGGSFGYLSYENKDTNGIVSNYSLNSSAGPGTNWDAAFNLSFDGYTSSGAPTLDDPSGGRTVVP